MTSGQGGEPESHGGTPEGGGGPQQHPGWGQPPAAPPYGPPPGQGYGPGHGQGYAPAPPPPPPGYGGYGPAPSAPPGWGGPPPAPMERPVTVRAGLGLFIAEIALGLVGAIYVFSNSQDLIDRVRSQAQSSNAQLSDSALHAALIAGAVIGLIVVAVELLFIWFAWGGRNWARVVLWVVGGLGIVSGLGGLATNSQFGGFYRTLGIFQLLIVVVAVILLALKPSNEWYRYRKWQRMTGQG